jgi:hypothetical protein
MDAMMNLTRLVTLAAFATFAFSASAATTPVERFVESLDNDEQGPLGKVVLVDDPGVVLGHAEDVGRWDRTAADFDKGMGFCPETQENRDQQVLRALEARDRALGIGF